MSLEKQSVFVQDADTKSPTTGNIYPAAILEELVANQPKQRFGELREKKVNERDPRWSNPEEMGVIKIDAASHIVTNLQFVHGKLLCNVKTLPTTAGQQLERLLSDPLQEPRVRFALRAFIEKEPDGTVTKLNLVTIDAVYDH